MAWEKLSQYSQFSSNAQYTLMEYKIMLILYIYRFKIVKKYIYFVQQLTYKQKRKLKRSD